MRIEALEIEDHILDKIESRHGVLFNEVEQVCYKRETHARRGRAGLYKLFGPTDGGRLLLVVLAHKGEDVWRVVTAREMNQAERRLYRRQMGA